MKKKMGLLVLLTAIIIATLLATGCATNKAVFTHLDPNVPFEDHALIYIDGINSIGSITRIAVFGINGNISNREIAATGDVLVLPPGEYILNVAANEDTSGWVPRHPGLVFEISVESGKYYRVSTRGVRSEFLSITRTVNFYFEDIDNPLSYSGDYFIWAFRNNPSALKAEMDRIVNNSR